ncbi:BREX-2 system adenine-specific DNA-methyltransferase PglX [Streptomyces meridianus]|uniref:site-specific DNA-methyltransferase (adenine-specific) n=1 Tax=Streptomyces meridianus TaxID=2938945 RepID=A0ABT0XAH5_9ACTN|nr:BREX-2 system adenine-specific DNA-methyltransferase PglX [Streptomyces meridianus]MCM2578717.1 BREX-2 system adenine-specific DNA-methyltransferase PglX [Streptomyces meridianus]
MTVEGGASGMATGVDRAGLLKDLKKQVAVLEKDLRERSESEEAFRTRLGAEYARALEGKRTAATYGAWRDERVTQAAAAWVLACVFVRFCEDNGLIEWPFLAGPGERLRDAEERHEAFFREKPHLNNRDWLVEAFQHLADANETAAGLFDRRHNPLWGLTPSYESATELLTFWRRRGPDGEIRYDFTDEQWDTRFLGDLYQDLSEHARKTYALLQTPEFVEEFILDLTLEPAIEEFGLHPEYVGPGGEVKRGLRTIDPACGSGHFLLGIFARLVDKWRAAEPGTDEWVVVRRALESAHGCDKNPFAVSIARFRLLVAAMRAAGQRRLAEAPNFPINVAVGDSLLHGRGATGIQTDLDTLFAEEGEGEAFQYATEDVGDFAKRVDLLGRGSYHVVVGNPPYITVKNKQENENYRKAYDACAGKYALSVPFAQRFFELGLRESDGLEGAGAFVGQITANSFMKREFGKKVIEEFFAQKVELSHVIDTSGAYIPGHGTPTVILVGRNRACRRSGLIRAVLGVRGEPSQPSDGASGLVWSAIVNQVDRPGSDSEWINVVDVAPRNLLEFPMNMSGGGASDVKATIDESSAKLKSRIASSGFGAITGDDDAYFLPRQKSYYDRPGAAVGRVFVEGEQVRDWEFEQDGVIVYPYSLDESQLDALESSILWPVRSNLRATLYFGKTKEERGMRWSEYAFSMPSRLEAKRLLSFSFVATQNNFTLLRGSGVYNKSAPVMVLPEGAGEDEHLELLGVLNSSTACFWLKQVSYPKGGDPVGQDGARVSAEAWSDRYEFTGTKLQEFPLPERLPLALGRALDSLAQLLGGCQPSAVAERDVPTRDGLDAAHAESSCTRRRMVALQEELDWQVYGSYGLLTQAETARVTDPSPAPTTIPEVQLGERAFEIVMARKMARGEMETAWFARHGSTPITEIPERWPDWYREIVQARIDIIESRKDIALIERPECKRRWASEPWEKKEKAALRTWLLDRTEKRDLWYALRDGMEQPRTLTVGQLADALRDDADFNSVAQLYATDHLGKPDLPLAEVLAEIVADEHVPYLAAMRYKDSGLRNREQWEQVWEMQREEDRTGQRLNIPVPPKYKSADFQKTSYWSHRGKLDVPKERFISYLEASPDADPSVLLGWAGWDHKDQAQALFNLVDDRTQQAGWETERIKPLLAGLVEVMPWVRQWHGEYDEEWEGVPADEYQAYFEELCAKHQVSEAELRAWRPEKKTRGRKKTAPKKAAQAVPDEE